MGQVAIGLAWGDSSDRDGDSGRLPLFSGHSCPETCRGPRREVAAAPIPPHLCGPSQRPWCRPRTGQREGGQGKGAGEGGSG